MQVLRFHHEIIFFLGADREGAELECLRKKKVFRELYQLAEVINLSPEDMNAYQESLKIKRDNYSALESAELRGEQRGQKLERAKAEQEKREMAVKLKTKGMHVEEIAELTNLSIAEIQALV